MVLAWVAVEVEVEVEVALAGEATVGARVELEVGEERARATR